MLVLERSRDVVSPMRKEEAVEQLSLVDYIIILNLDMPAHQHSLIVLEVN